jgi:hypothetical protein
MRQWARKCGRVYSTTRVSDGSRSVRDAQTRAVRVSCIQKSPFYCPDCNWSGLTNMHERFCITSLLTKTLRNKTCNGPTPLST